MVRSRSGISQAHQREPSLNPLRSTLATHLRMQTSYVIAQTRRRADTIDVKPYKANQPPAGHSELAL